MPSITALIHTANDAFILGRALETVYPCDEILVIDHGSRDATVRVAREYGAQVVAATELDQPARFLHLARHDWILCLEPSESLSEGLAASLFEWKCSPPPARARGFSVFLRQQTDEGWLDLPEPQVRLVVRDWDRWAHRLPAYTPAAPTLEGPLLRFGAFPSRA